MKRRDWIVLAILQRYGYNGVSDICLRSGLPVEYAEGALALLRAEGYLTADYSLTPMAQAIIEERRPRRAVILAAGDGGRMYPERRPKGLLTLNDEPLIERMIHQLHEAGVFEIWAVVGYRKESFEYLTDRLGVNLIINDDYASHDSLRSLRRALDFTTLENCYIAPSNLWFARTPFSQTEYFSWYGLTGVIDDESFIRADRQLGLVRCGSQSGNTMLGLAYLLPHEGRELADRITRMDTQHRYSRAQWEEGLFRDGKSQLYAKLMVGQPHFIVRTYEQIGDLEEETEQRRAALLDHIANSVGVEDRGQITGVHMLKKGMTNKLMRFDCRGEQYLLRIPGEGSNSLTDRREEEAVYAALEGLGVSDSIVSISGDTGFKITRFWDDARPCDPGDWEDVERCMALLRRLHSLGLKVEHQFDFAAKLAHYEGLRGESSGYTDYISVRSGALSLLEILDRLPRVNTLCHIDSVSDNFLFTGHGLYLIDWEYAGMCDPAADVAMFCLYAGYEREDIDRVIDIYYQGASPEDRVKVYCYISLGGLLWSQWCEYKSQFGVQYGEYAMSQYRYARKYAQYARRLYDRLEK